MSLTWIEIDKLGVKGEGFQGLQAQPAPHFFTVIFFTYPLGVIVERASGHAEQAGGQQDGELHKVAIIFDFKIGFINKLIS